jgi:hypothetical protein
MPIVRIDAEFDSRDALTPERALVRSTLDFFRVCAMLLFCFCRQIWRIHVELFGDDPYMPEVKLLENCGLRNVFDHNCRS